MLKEMATICLSSEPFVSESDTAQDEKQDNLLSRNYLDKD